MKKNIGSIDKAARIIIAAILVALALTKVIEGSLAIILLVFSGILVATSLISFCPIYVPFKLNSAKKNSK